MNSSSSECAGAVRLGFAAEVATVLIDRPAKLNAFTPEMLEQLGQVLAEVASSDARVVVVRGAGEKAFCVGADINRFGALSPTQMWRYWGPLGHEVFDKLARLPQPTVAVVHALALGGGLELALACDFRVVAAEARLGMPEVGRGTVPGWGGTERLTELVGRSRAKEIILARRSLDGQGAMQIGLASRVAPRCELASAVDSFVADLLAGPPSAVQLAKQLIDATARGVPSGVMEPLASGLSASTEEFKEGVAAFASRSGQSRLGGGPYGKEVAQ